MSSPIILGEQDEMLQRAAHAQQQQQQQMAFIQGVEKQVLITAFTQLSIDHRASGEPLTLEVGREIAKMAGEVTAGYTGFLLESLGLATMNTVDKT